MTNIFNNIPSKIPTEIFEDIINNDKIRIERIVSKGHSSPDKGWYDQKENEWVIVLSGFGEIEYIDGDIVTLNQGDYLHIKPHVKHRVKITSKQVPTVWLAIFY